MNPNQRVGSAAALCAAITVALLIAAAPFRANAPADSSDGGSSPPLDTGPQTIPLTPPQKAAQLLQVPPGFQASLFASEPMVRQPIGIATDSRGRLWVAENDTYSERTLNFDLRRHDRIVILEDTNGNGSADRRTVFWDGAQQLTSIELGFGGVWALCPPKLLFIPDRDGDDRPDGEPQIILDGWDHGAVRHNIANGLRWGPDGWLYGRHGIQATSLVGAPGSLPSQRTALNCCIWRYHPVRRVFEVVCRGTTNPWGMDWNAEGELFFINTVIGHLWHAIPGAHFQRMYGEDDNSRLYELMGQTADHVHWDHHEHWARAKAGLSRTTDEAGGGHAHAGLMIYTGDVWPARYRGSLFTANMHGHRLNNDTLSRSGCGYVGRHAADFLKTSDPWFRAVEVMGGPREEMYIADWCEVADCHNDVGVNRSSGRIYRVTYGDAKPFFSNDLAQLPDPQLVALQKEDEWSARKARRILQERAASGRLSGTTPLALRKLFDADPSTAHQLRALWCLHGIAADPETWLLTLLRHPTEPVRVWAIRLLEDGKAPSVQARSAFLDAATRDSSGLVLAYLASSLQRIPFADRWPLAERLVTRGEYASDKVLPLMVWYGIEPAIADDPDRAAHLAEISRLPLVSRLLTRRLTENVRLVPVPVDRLVAFVATSRSAGQMTMILSGMAEALRGWQRAPCPRGWSAAQASVTRYGDDTAHNLARELSAVFGDGRSTEALLQLAVNGTDIPSRRDALRLLIDTKDPRLEPLLRGLLRDRDLGADAARGLAVFDKPDVGSLLVRSYGRLHEPTQAAAVITLCSRPGWARMLLKAVAEREIDRRNISTFQVRQMLAFADADMRRRISELWPQLKPLSAGRKEQIALLKRRLEGVGRGADASHGRLRFLQTCATCHVLFGEGHTIGPDLTGSQRTNLDYLLENIVDPSASVTPAYRMSTVVLSDGRVLNGILNDSGGPTVALQTPTERLVVERARLESVRRSDRSLMPEGLLDLLSEQELRDLFAYLMSPQQIPLPVGVKR